MMRADGRDDPALAETTWPLPDADEDDRDSIEWRLRYAEPDRSTLLAAAGIVAAYGALIADGTTTEQTRRLAAGVPPEDPMTPATHSLRWPLAWRSR